MQIQPVLVMTQCQLGVKKLTTRAEKITQQLKTREIFSDFLDGFNRHPVTSALARVVNDNAINQSIKNLVFTNRGERPFDLEIGCDISKALFEPNDYISAENIKMYVKDTLSRYEPRIDVKDVVVDYSTDRDTFKLTIVYYILNTSTLSSVDLLIKRVR